MSGDDTLYLNRYKRQGEKLQNPHIGTFMGIVLDLNNPLPLEEIYEKAAEEYTGYPDQEGLTETMAVNPISVEKK